MHMHFENITKKGFLAISEGENAVTERVITRILCNIKVTVVLVCNVASLRGLM